MSPIGRIFIVLNLILAVAFLGWASASLSASQEWKTQYEDEVTAHANTKSALEEQLSDERQKRTKAEGDLSTMRGEKERLDSLMTSERSAKERSEQDLSELKASYDSLAGTIQEYGRRNEDLASRLEDFANRLTEATDGRHSAENTASVLEGEKNELQRQLAEANTQIATLEGDAVALNEQIADLDTQLTTIVAATKVTVGELVNQPQIDGAVMMVSHEIQPGLVSINRGEDAGVKRGFTFDIFSNGLYKGRVRVEDVQQDSCTAVIMRTYEDRIIEQGDTATTHI